jgi:HSP20 family molecular chaperone IbpA
VDIFETDKELLLLADMPGVDESSVDIQLEDNELTIHGCVNEEQQDGLNLIHREYPVGGYRRVFSVTDLIDKENIRATVKNGELRLVLPKSAPLSRKIPVSAA